MSGPSTRRVRFVCISDTHNASPKSGAFKLPQGDVLIHAGDLTRQGTYQELRKALEWIDQAKYERKIVVAGNHDISLDEVFYSAHGATMHNQHPEDVHQCLSLFQEFPSITYLNHEATEIELSRTDSAPGIKLRVFGSPYSPSTGKWAFGYPPAEAKALWQRIPANPDILVTHTPPKGHCDRRDNGMGDGCDELLGHVLRSQPRLHVCGHIHNGRGVSQISWNANGETLAGKTGDEGKISGKDTHMKETDVVLGRSSVTLIINAAIMATSWPYRCRDGSLYNQPFVVDLDLSSGDSSV